jgi:hypothetical protein
VASGGDFGSAATNTWHTASLIEFDFIPTRSKNRREGQSSFLIVRVFG